MISQIRGNKEGGIAGPYILAFDHRDSYSRGLFPNQEITPEIKTAVSHTKEIIYGGFRRAVEKGLPWKRVPRKAAALLVDEESGSEIITDAVQRGYTVAVATEASGKKDLIFQYENTPEGIAGHLTQYTTPEGKGITYAKVLVRYNPQDPLEQRQEKLNQLKKLSDIVKQKRLQLLIEPLIPATPEQKQQYGEIYDTEIRPSLAVEMIRQFQEAGIKTHVWKIEGMENPEQYQAIVEQARSGEGNENVKVIVLGRGAETEQVDRWLRAGAQIDGVDGLAIGRTIFDDGSDSAIRRYMRVAGQAAPEVTANLPKFDWLNTPILPQKVRVALAEKRAERTIARNYRRFVHVFESAKNQPSNSGT